MTQTLAETFTAYALRGHNFAPYHMAVRNTEGVSARFEGYRQRLDDAQTKACLALAVHEVARQSESMPVRQLAAAVTNLAAVQVAHGPADEEVTKKFGNLAHKAFDIVATTGNMPVRRRLSTLVSFLNVPMSISQKDDMHEKLGLVLKYQPANDVLQMLARVPEAGFGMRGAPPTLSKATPSNVFQKLSVALGKLDKAGVSKSKQPLWMRQARKQAGGAINVGARGKKPLAA